jgi:hypothetical protein
MRKVWTRNFFLRQAFSANNGRLFEAFDPYRSTWNETLDDEVSRLGENFVILFNKLIGKWGLVVALPNGRINIKGYYDREGEIIHDIRKGRWMRDNNKKPSDLEDLMPSGSGVDDPEVQEEIEKGVHDASVQQGLIDRKPSVVL